jgi:hypothetical protein
MVYVEFKKADELKKQKPPGIAGRFVGEGVRMSA